MGPSICSEFLGLILDISWSSTLNSKYDYQQSSELWILVSAHYFLYIFDGLFVCELFNHIVNISHCVELNDQVKASSELKGV